MASPKRRRRWLEVFVFAVPTLVALWYFWNGAKVWLGKPVIRRDYLKAISTDALKIPEADRAWPLLRAAALTVEPAPIVKWNPTDDAGWRLIWASPGNPKWPDLVAILERNSDELEIARQASRKPHLGFVWGDPLDYVAHCQMNGYPAAGGRFSDPTPALNGLLSVSGEAIDLFAEMLVKKAVLALTQGDQSTMVDNLDAALRLLAMQGENPRSIGLPGWFETMGLVDSLYELADGRYLPEGALSSESLRRLSAAAASIDFAAMAHRDIELCRDRFDFWLEHNCTGVDELTMNGIVDLIEAGGNWDRAEAWHDYVGKREWLKPLIAARMPSGSRLRARLTEALDAEWARFQAPLARRSADWRSPRAGSPTAAPELSPFAAIRFAADAGHSAIDRVVPDITGDLELQIMRRDALVVGLALELYRRDRASWPDRLQDLVPHYLERVPTDRISGEPFRYTLRDGKPLLYSVGADRDDDGGRLPGHAQLDRRTATRHASEWFERTEYDEMRTKLFWDSRYDGDWILWPAVPPTWTR